MATAQIQLTQAWALAADEAEEFLLENPFSSPIHFTFQDSTPNTNSPHHTLKASEALMRMGLSGDLYVRAASAATGLYVTLSK